MIIGSNVWGWGGGVLQEIATHFDNINIENTRINGLHSVDPHEVV